MTKSKTPFANARVEKSIRAAGATRVSADAVYVLNELLGDVASDINGMAVDIARHTGRVTVKGDDIKLASQKYLK